MMALDLFSGIGAAGLGMWRAGFQTAAFCEINPSRRAVLAQHFPGVPIHDDIRTLHPERADIVAGGPPCQRTSVAAAVHGYRDGESLWPHMLRVVGIAQPDWVVVEQPPGHTEWEAEVAGDLRDTGRHVARFEFGACDIGAPYLRRRVFMVACASLPRLEIAWCALPSTIDRIKRAADARGDWHPYKFRTLRVDARSAGEMDRGRSRGRRERIEALGDANPPHMMEAIGRAILSAWSPVTTNAGCEGLAGVVSQTQDVGVSPKDDDKGVCRV